MRNAAIIMAGGAGTRLWPLSRASRPKQLLHILDGRSLIREAFERLRPSFSTTDIFVIALAEHLPAIAKELPALPPENFIGEPMGRDTANAIALAAAILHQRDAETVMGVFTADHLIRPVAKFTEIVRQGFDAATRNPSALVTFGVKPTEPHTGLGYVERGDAVSPGVWAVNSFKEKPDLETARRYVSSKNYYWNSGMFAWRTSAILDQLERRLPNSHEAARKLAEVWNTAHGNELAGKIYPTLERISIDYAVMEKAAAEPATGTDGPPVLVVEMDVDWLDVGNWTALSSVLPADGEGNTKALSNSVLLDSKGNILVSEDDHLIATIGVEDLVIVHSQDATLVCRKDEIQKIKQIVEHIEQEYGGRHT